MEQLTLFEIQEKKKSNKTTFVNNMKLPIHRWYRYSAGFSAEWVEEILKKKNDSSIQVYDPFAGSGTVLISCDKLGISSMGVDPHPFINRIADAKLQWDTDIVTFKNFAYSILERATVSSENVLEKYPVLVYKSYSEENLLKLQKINNELKRIEDKSTPQFRLTWLALSSILRVSSGVGTAQWQYVLPNKKTIAKDPFIEFEKKINDIIVDMQDYQAVIKKSKAKFFREDARDANGVPDNWADLVITSPPYANNYDYADATRLELSFYNEVGSWGDLQDKVRKHLIVSNTQHVSKVKEKTWEVARDASLSSIFNELEVVLMDLEKERENHGGKKNYHTMIANYFFDMAKVWTDLRRIVKEGGEVCFVIGDSAPYGVYVPVDKWLGELAIASGFKSFEFIKERDRNIKWKNRTHTIPLKEGYLWVKG